MPTERLKGTSRYLAFPFRMTHDGGAASARMDHIREEIAQVLMTGPGERVFLPQFGLGAQRLLFAPMTNELWRRIESSLAAGISEALKGEAVPGSVSVSAGPSPGSAEQLDIVVRYTLAALNKQEELPFTLADGALTPGGPGGG